MKDLIVIGKGPAGISAAIYVKRAGLDVTVIGNGYGSLYKTDKIENYYGFANPITGKELIDTGILQAQNLGIEVLSEEVTSIAFEDTLVVKTTKNQYPTKTVLLATGKSRITLKIKNMDQFDGRGISYCAVCDGFFYRGKKIAVIGSGDYAAAELHELQSFTKDITLFTNGEPLTTSKIDDSISVVTDRITEVQGEQNVNKIITENGTYDIDGIFVAVGTADASDFAKKLGIFLNGKDIAVDENYATNIPGVYAAGDCIGGFLQVSKAVGDGALASKSIISYLKSTK